MNFKEWFIITESKEEKTLALELAGNQENYNELNRVIPQNQKESDPLILLAAYYLSQSKNINQTKEYIQNYIQLTKNNKMPLIKVNLTTKKPDAPFDKYLNWTQIIDGHQGEEKAKQAKKFKPSDIDFQNEKPIATSPDGLIKVYQSNSPNQCIILGKGQSFCISQPGNTMWKSYRDTKGSTFYFVYDDSRQDNLSIVVVDASINGLELTDRINTTGKIQNPDNPSQRDKDPQIYMDYLKSKGINTNIFKNLPKTQEELDEDKKLGTTNQDLNWFTSLSPQEKSNYIGRGHKLTDQQFNFLWHNKFNSSLEQYVKTGLQLNDYQIDKISTNKDLKNNYIHNRLIALQNDFNINKKEWDLLNDQQKDKLAQIPNAVEDAVQVDNNSEIIKYLIDKGAEIGNAVQNAALYTNNLEIIKYLIDKGAKIGDDTLVHAIQSGDIDLVKYLIEIKKIKIPGGAVNFAAISRNLELVKYLIDEKKAPIDSGAVENAVYNGDYDMVKYLVDVKHAPISDHALDFAVEKNHPEMLRYLLQKGKIYGDDTFQQAAAKINYKQELENSLS